MTRTIGEFVKTTVIGGLLIVVPTYLAVLLLVKAIGGIVALLAPIVALMPGDQRFGRLIAIALAGSLYILPRERVHWVDASMTEAVAVITRWGAGTSKLVKAMRPETTAIGGGIP